jgi:hypothetical protein
MIVIVLMIVRIVWQVMGHCLGFELGKGNGRLIPEDRPEEREATPRWTWLLAKH